MTISWVNDMYGNFGLESPQIAHLYDDHCYGLEEAAALQTAAVVPGDDSASGQCPLQIEFLRGKPCASWAVGVLIDLLVGFHHGCEHVGVLLNDSCTVLGLHFFKVHDESILAECGG